MLEYIVAFAIGIALIIIGVITFRGNISLLHSYHRKRVSEEDKIPFARQTGIGLIIVGAGMCVGNIFMIVEYITEQAIFNLVGTAILIAGLIVGLAISFWAMKKYNKGIF